VLWYCKSNSYSIVESSFKKLLDDYLKSETLDAFKTKLAYYDIDLNVNQLTETLKTYLADCNKIMDSHS